MSLQSTLNWDAINMLPKVKHAIATAENFEANQMLNSALRRISNYRKALCDMNTKEINRFDTELVKIFKFHGWL